MLPNVLLADLLDRTRDTRLHVDALTHLTEASFAEDTAHLVLLEHVL